MTVEIFFIGFIGGMGGFEVFCPGMGGSGPRRNDSLLRWLNPLLCSPCWKVAERFKFCTPTIPDNADARLFGTSQGGS